MDALHPLDRHEIARAVCKKLGLVNIGGGTMLSYGSRKARSDVSFRVIKRRKGKGKSK